MHSRFIENHSIRILEDGPSFLRGFSHTDRPLVRKHATGWDGDLDWAMAADNLVAERGGEAGGAMQWQMRYCVNSRRLSPVVMS
jgi:hypothetical protein